MVDVVARVDNSQGENVVVEEVLFPKENPPLKAGDTIQVAGLAKCRPLPDSLVKNNEPAPDWMGPGQYLLPLQSDPKSGAEHFKVVPTPRSPGYPPRLQNPPRDYPEAFDPGPPRIYPATPELLAEYRNISKTR